MNGLDLGAALHCARTTATDYQRRRVELPEWLKEYFWALWSFADETACEAPQQQSSHDTFIGADAAADILGWTPQWVRRKRTDLDGQKCPCGHWIFPRQAVIDYANASAVAG